MNFFSNFSWAVPQAFSDAAALCRFEEGDILYDTQKAYEGSWKDASRHINYSLQVRYPVSATSNEIVGNKGSVFEKNWNSTVKIDLYQKLKKVDVGQIETTQGRLYTVLWKGDLEVLDTNSKNPTLPLRVREVTTHLNQCKEDNFTIPAEGPVFAMAQDSSNQVSCEKLRKVHKQLYKYLSTDEPIKITPEKFGLKNWEQVSPTLDIAIFPVNSINTRELESLIKTALYVPSQKTGNDRFKISAHGAIFGQRVTNTFFFNA